MIHEANVLIVTKHTVAAVHRANVNLGIARLDETFHQTRGGLRAVTLRRVARVAGGAVSAHEVQHPTNPRRRSRRHTDRGCVHQTSRVGTLLGILLGTLHEPPEPTREDHGEEREIHLRETRTRRFRARFSGCQVYPSAERFGANVPRVEVSVEDSGRSMDTSGSGVSRWTRRPKPTGTRERRRRTPRASGGREARVLRGCRRQTRRVRPANARRSPRRAPGEDRSEEVA